MNAFMYWKRFPEHANMFLECTDAYKEMKLARASALYGACNQSSLDCW